MSAITEAIIAETARQRLNWAANEAPRLRAMIPSALKALGIRVARRADLEALRTEIDVTCTAGIITLTDPTILVEVLLETGELILNGRVAKSAPSYQDLTLKLPADVYRWSLRGSNKIYVADLVTGSLGVVSQTGVLAFNFTPTLSQMPDNYDKELIDIVVTLASGIVEKPLAPELDKDEGLSVNLNAK